jgi:L-lactate utilization protein LutC
MAKYKNNQIASPETHDQAMKIAKATKKPNQTKEQTKLIAQGIQKGIVEYKKQQKVKAREQNKQKNKTTQKQSKHSSLDAAITDIGKCKTQWLPWILLLISWVLMIGFVLK